MQFKNSYKTDLNSILDAFSIYDGNKADMAEKESKINSQVKHLHM